MGKYMGYTSASDGQANMASVEFREDTQKCDQLTGKMENQTISNDTKGCRSFPADSPKSFGIGEMFSSHLRFRDLSSLGFVQKLGDTAASCMTRLYN